MPRLAPRFDAPGYYARGDVRSAGAGASARPHARPLVGATAQYTSRGHPANFASKRIGAGAGPERHTRYTQRGDFVGHAAERALAEVLDHGFAETAAEESARAAATVLCDICDTDGDGQLDLFEIIHALMHRPHLLKPLGLKASSTDVDLFQTFTQADADGSGSIDRDELMELILRQAEKQDATTMFTKDAVRVDPRARWVVGDEAEAPPLPLRCTSTRARCGSTRTRARARASSTGRRC